MTARGGGESEWVSVTQLFWEMFQENPSTVRESWGIWHQDCVIHKNWHLVTQNLEEFTRQLSSDQGLTKSLFWQFFYCCSADFCPRQPVNQLYNTKKIDKHKDFASPWQWKSGRVGCWWGSIDSRAAVAVDPLNLRLNAETVWLAAGSVVSKGRREDEKRGRACRQAGIDERTGCPCCGVLVEQPAFN